MTTKTLTLNKFNLHNGLGLALVALGVAMFFIADRIIAPALGLTLIENETLNNIFRYQVTMLVLTFGFLAVLFVLFRDKFRTFARFGDSSAHPEPVRWLGIKASNTWRGVGINFAIIVSLGTAIFMFIGGLEGDLSRLKLGYLGLAIIFALSNSFIEEAITRFGVVVSLHGTLPDRYVALASGLIFGIPHYLGTPGGPVGALMAGFMGWLLAKSMLETRGVFWAWFIHFLQDVIIFMVMASVVLG